MAIANPPVEDVIAAPPRRYPTAAPTIDAAGLAAAIDEIRQRRPAVGLAVGVVANGGLEFFRGHGLADIASRTSVTEDTGFRIASITKTFTAIAVLQLWERGLIDLDAPVNNYLRSFQLLPAKAAWPPTTVRQLLTHTGGIPEQAHLLGLFRPDYGESVPLGLRVPSLAEYYRGGLRVAVKPGTTFMYGNHSPATLGQIVEDVSGQPLDCYFREQIFEPLGMADTDLLRSERLQSRMAIGYKLAARGPKPVAPREWVTAGAAGIYSTTRDMARYVAALLGGGSNGQGSVLKPETLASMFDPHYQPEPRLPGMGLAFFRRNLGGHRAVEHMGSMPGFNSQIWIAPDDGIGLLAFTNGSPQAVMWMPVEFGQLLRALLGASAERIRTDTPQHPEIWSELCGWYRLPIPLSNVQARMYLGAGLEVLVRRGRLVARFLNLIPELYKGFELHPDDAQDPYVFTTESFGHVVFSRDPGSARVSMHLEVQPISLAQQSRLSNPRLWVGGALGTLAATTGARGIRRRIRLRRLLRPHLKSLLKKTR